MPTQEQVQQLIQNAIRDGVTPDGVLEALISTFGWNQQQALDVFVTHAANIGLNSFTVGGNTFNLTPTGSVTPLPIPGDVNQAITTPPAAGDTGTGDQSGGLFGEQLTGRPSTAQAFSRFLATQPFAATPNLRTAAGRLRPLLETQFALQPNVEGQGFGEFGDFLSGGQRLRGQDLLNRLGSVASAVAEPFGGILAQSNPLGAALQQQFTDPGNAFAAFQLPTLQKAGGVGRDLLSDAFAAFQNRFLGQNPNASSADIARLFGFQV